LRLADDIQFVAADNNMFRDTVPQRHYVTIYISAHAVNESELENTEPDKCEGWEWVAAEKLTDNRSYQPLFVPMRHIFIKLALVKE